MTGLRSYPNCTFSYFPSVLLYPSLTRVRKCGIALISSCPGSGGYSTPAHQVCTCSRSRQMCLCVFCFPIIYLVPDNSCRSWARAHGEPCEKRGCSGLCCSGGGAQGGSGSLPQRLLQLGGGVNSPLVCGIFGPSARARGGQGIFLCSLFVV